MKKLVALSLALLMLAGLGSSLADETTFLIGLAQFAVHGSLDNCREGFLAGLKDKGFEDGVNLRVDYQNAQADMGIAAAIADKFVKSNCDMIAAIATPMAVVSFNAADDKIPVIYTAVSAPIKAGLANEDGSGLGKATGTSDLLPVKAQLHAIRALQPEAKVIGILYTLSETNSAVQVEQYKALAPELGFTVEAMGIATGADVALATPALLKKVDLISMVLDNTVVQYLDTVIEAADAAGIPVYGSEIEQVLRGCVAAQGLDYFELGRKTGHMAARVLMGENAQDIPFEKIEDSKLYYDSAKIAALKLTLPEGLEGEDVSKQK